MLLSILSVIKSRAKRSPNIGNKRIDSIIIVDLSIVFSLLFTYTYLSSLGLETLGLFAKFLIFFCFGLYLLRTRARSNDCANRQVFT